MSLGSDQTPKRSNSLRNHKLLPRDISESLGKLPPQAVDLEEAVLGAVMLEKGAISQVLQILRPEHFYVEPHKEIFQAIVDLNKKGEPIDMRTVVNQLRRTGKVEIIGGAYYIAELTAKVSSAANVEYHAMVIFEKFILRELIMMASSVHHDAYEDTCDMHELLDRSEAHITAIRGGFPGGQEVSMKDLVFAITKELNERTDDIQITGVPGGYPKIDKITHGWQKSDLVIIAARPGMGKTAFTVGTLLNAAHQGHPVGMFSLEMSAYQIGLRATSVETEMEMHTIKKKKFDVLDFEHWAHRTSKLSGLPIFIDDSAALSINELRNRARRMKARYNIELLVVDYIQLMKGDLASSGKGNREQEISSISRGLKAIAKELNIPVLALSQLSREVEKRGGDKIPMLADLRDSGSIEQDADIVMFIWRPEYYKITADGYGTFINGLTKFIIAKHRNGSLGEPYLQFIAKYTKFQHSDYSYLEQQEKAIEEAKADELRKLGDYERMSVVQSALPPGDRTNAPLTNDDIPF